MKVNIEEIKNTIERLEEIVAEMECRGIDELQTEGNTYWCGNNFISYGYNGYLDLDSALEKIWNSDKEDEEDYE